jgi:cytochrome c oxidase assembly protein subunit 15
VLRERLSPSTFRRITALAAVAVGVIIVTGGAVRVTGSGLGCPDWPTCARNRVVAPWEYHALVEFGNRAVTGAVSVLVIAAVLGSLVRRPRRRDLVVLSLGLVAGVLAQIVLGGLTVLFKLAPPFVMGHFLLSMALLADAVVLHHRAGLPDGAWAARPLVGPGPARLARLVLALTAVVVVLGTVVTSSGPHGGDVRAKRLSFTVHDTARVHGTAVITLLALTLALVWWLHRSGAPESLQRRATVFVEVLGAQAVVGYAQYFTQIPAALVAVHIAGAAAAWASAVWLACGLRVAIPAGSQARDAAPAGPLTARETILSGT